MQAGAHRHPAQVKPRQRDRQVLAEQTCRLEVKR